MGRVSRLILGTCAMLFVVKDLGGALISLIVRPLVLVFVTCVVTAIVVGTGGFPPIFTVVACFAICSAFVRKGIQDIKDSLDLGGVVLDWTGMSFVVTLTFLVAFIHHVQTYGNLATAWNAAF